MPPDEAAAPDGEEQGKCWRPDVRSCPFPEGNDTEFPYQLSIHGAWMLERGIEAYARQARAMHESGEDASYCLMMTRTAIGEARKLREWAVRAAPNYLEGMIGGLDELLQELASQEEHFGLLASQEMAGRRPAASLDDLFGQEGGAEGEPS